MSNTASRGKTDVIALPVVLHMVVHTAVRYAVARSGLRDMPSMGPVPPAGRRRARSRTGRSLQLEPYLLQVAERPYRHVIQAMEPEAQRLLLQGGGNVLRDQEGSLDEESLDCPWPILVISWPIQTRLVYLAVRGQEESSVLFVAALLPGLRGERHLTSEDRPWDPVFGPFEECFTLRVAQVRLWAAEAND